jgi:hypothetical protein
VPAIAAQHRFPAVKLSAKQQAEVAERKDKTGSRTFGGVPPGVRRRTTFAVQTYMTSWDSQQDPGYGPLFQASLGAAPLRFAGTTAGAGSTDSTLVFAAAHGLAPGQAITYAGQIRFVAAAISSTAVQLNARLSAAPPAGAPIGATISYFPALQTPSISIFDYWSPGTAVQRILAGAAVDRMEIRVNGDYHEFEFSGMAQDLIDNATLTSGSSQLSSFPEEPPLGAFDYSIVPGHLGQAWLGTTPDRFYTITKAAFLLDNSLDMRAKEFGSNLPLGFAAGRRKVTTDFDLFEQDDDTTKALYQAARQQSPIAVMFQLGEQDGQLVGVYMKSVVPEVPVFDDSDARVQWRFRESRAQGTVDDEIVVAIG